MKEDPWAEEALCVIKLMIEKEIRWIKFLTDIKPLDTKHLEYSKKYLNFLILRRKQYEDYISSQN